MAISQRTQINPQSMADNWSAGVGRSGAKWLSGVKSPRRMPNADPAKAGANWTAGVAQAEPSYVSGLSSPNYLTNLENGATAKQGSYTGSGTARKASAQAAFGKVATMITNVLPTLPAKGPRGTNIQRAVSFATAMHALKGQGKA